MSDGRLAPGYGDVYDGWEASAAWQEAKELRKELAELREELGLPPKKEPERKPGEMRRGTMADFLRAAYAKMDIGKK